MSHDRGGDKGKGGMRGVVHARCAPGSYREVRKLGKKNVLSAVACRTSTLGVCKGGVPSHGREGEENKGSLSETRKKPRWGSGGERGGPGAEPEVVCTPRPCVHDHYQRTREYLPAGTNLAVVVGSNRHSASFHLHYAMPLTHRLPLHRLLQSRSRMYVVWTLYLDSDSMRNAPHSTSRL